MGTDIAMLCEVRKNGKWTGNRKKIFPTYNDEEKTEWPYIYRNYDLFAILANVRNGYGFAGCYTGEEFNPIDECKGLPDDVTKYTKDRLYSCGYGESYYTLTELEKYDWQQQHKAYGCVEYDEYAETVAKGKMPTHWCGGVIGDSIRVIPASKFPLKRRLKKFKYYVEGEFPAETYAEAVGSFYSTTIPLLRSLIPEGGTSDDVRIVFNFDC